MAKKKARRSTKEKAPRRAKKKATKRRPRTPQNILADLRDRVRHYEELADATSSPSMRQALAIVRSLNKTLDQASEDGNSMLRYVLSDARRPLAKYLRSQGMDVPTVKLPRGRRPSPG